MAGRVRVVISEEVNATLAKLRGQGKAAIITAKENGVAGVIALSDTLRENAPGMVEKLKQGHTETVLLTGEHVQTANHFAGQVGIANVHAGLLPEQKVWEIQKLQQSGKTVCMIGDGVNDAPVLKCWHPYTHNRGACA